MTRMEILCDVCERAEAALLCCADEAALCWGCDEKIHAANKLAGKHQRVPLLPRSSGNSSSPSQTPVCDICQVVCEHRLLPKDKAGYFLCLEDRALLCWQCDVAIHTVSPLVSSHQRFLITGVRVALQHYHNNSSDNNNNNSSSSTSYANSSASSNTNSSNHLCSMASTNMMIPSKKLRSAAPTGCLKAEEMEGLKPTQWTWSDFQDDAEQIDGCYGISEPGSSN